VFVGFTGADIRHAREALAQVGTTLDRMPQFASLVMSRSTEKIELRRTDGRVVVFQCLPATPSAPRGRWFLAVVVTEADYLGASDGAAPAEEVVRAYAARLVRGGVLLAETTPWLENGHWHKGYTSNYGQPSTMLVCRAPTLVFFPTSETRALVQGERARDPVNAAREYECTWVPAGAAYFDAGAIDRAVDGARPLTLPPGAPSRVGVGLDLAFRGDSSVLVAALERVDGIVDVARVDVAKPERGKPLIPSAVIEAFAGIAKSYGASLVACDSHYSEVAREILAAHSIVIEACGTSIQGKLAAYAHTRELLHTGKLRLPPTGPLRDELRAVTVRHVGHGGTKIESPRRPGSHGDAAAALVAACWALKLATDSCGADEMLSQWFGERRYRSQGAGVVATIADDASMFDAPRVISGGRER
jgi:hypothetical protein